MRSFKIVERVEIEGMLASRQTIEDGISSLSSAKKKADTYADRVKINRDDGLDEHHAFIVIDEDTGRSVYETW